MGVTSFWQISGALAHGPDRLRADGEFALWRAGTAHVIETLLSSQRAHRGWPGFRSAHVEDGHRLAKRARIGRARAFARRESTRHLARWELDNGPVRT